MTGWRLFHGSYWYGMFKVNTEMRMPTMKHRVYWVGWREFPQESMVNLPKVQVTSVLFPYNQEWLDQGRFQQWEGDLFCVETLRFDSFWELFKFDLAGSLLVSSCQLQHTCSICGSFHATSLPPRAFARIASRAGRQDSCSPVDYPLVI